MTGVSVRDVDAQKFIEAYAAFLKRQGKLPIPGMCDKLEWRLMVGFSTGRGRCALWLGRGHEKF